MSLKKIDLIWRLIIPNIVFAFIGIISLNNNQSDGIYMIFTNCIFVIFLVFQIIRKNLTMNSKLSDVLLVYFAYKIVGCSPIIDSNARLLLFTMSTIFEGIWLYNFYLIPKSRQQ